MHYINTLERERKREKKREREKERENYKSVLHRLASSTQGKVP